MWIRIRHTACNQWWGSVTFWCGSGSLTNVSGSDSVTLRMQIFFSSYFFLITYPLAHNLQSLFYRTALKINFVFKFLSCKLQALFQSAHHLYVKREWSGSVPLTNGSRSGRPKNMGIQRIRIPNTACNCNKMHKNIPVRTNIDSCCINYAKDLNLMHI